MSFIKKVGETFMIKINSIKQIDELVAEQLGWHLVTIRSDYDDYISDITKWCPQEIDEDKIEQWLHNKCEEDYSYYDCVPEFTLNPYWNQDILDYLLIDEQCKVIYTLYPDRTEVTIDYFNSDRVFCETYRLYIRRAEQLALCLAFLNYKGVEFTLDKTIYNDINNS